MGDPLLVWKAAAALGIEGGAADAATAAGLVELGAQVRFRHPLVRSAVYGAAVPEDRRRVHEALAEATDAEVDPDRRAWHRAQATAGLDEDVAAELERSASRARARGGLAAGAAFHERAAELTPDPKRRAQRALAAAQGKHQAGAPDAALHLLAMAEAGPLDELEQARAQLLHAQITFATTRGRDAPPLLLAAAKRLEPLDAGLAHATYLEAFAAAFVADRLAVGGDAREVAAAVLAADWGPLRLPRPCGLMMDGLARLTCQGYAIGAPALKEALRAFRDVRAVRGGGAALAVAGLSHRPGAWRRRGVGRADRAPGRARAAGRRAVAAAGRPGRPDPRRPLRRPGRGGDVAGGRGGRRRGGDRQPDQPARSHRAGQLARPGGRSPGADRGASAGRDEPRRRPLARPHRLGQRRPLQRPRPLRRRPRRRGARRRGRARARHPDVGARRSDRGRRPQRQARACRRPARPADRDRRGQRHRLGAGIPRPLPRAARRAAGRRAALPRGDRAARPHAHPRGARPHDARVRRVAAAREPPRRRARAAPRRARDAHGRRHGGLRRAGPSRAAGDRGDGAQADASRRWTI